MAFRVLMDVLGGEARMRVSLPGKNAKLGRLDEMAFDIRMATVGRAVRGTISIPNGTNAERTVNFGKSFAHPPMFLFGYPQGSFFIQGHQSQGITINPDGNVINAATQVYAEIFTTRVKFLNTIKGGGNTPVRFLALV